MGAYVWCLCARVFLRMCVCCEGGGCDHSPALLLLCFLACVVARECVCGLCVCVWRVCVQSNVLPSTTSAERRFILLNGKLEVHHAPCTPLQMLLSLGGLGGKVVRGRVTE
jgi:hypothetical protein